MFKKPPLEYDKEDPQLGFAIFCPVVEIAAELGTILYEGSKLPRSKVDTHIGS